jgi:hypothetical protein
VPGAVSAGQRTGWFSYRFSGMWIILGAHSATTVAWQEVFPAHRSEQFSGFTTFYPSCFGLVAIVYVSWVWGLQTGATTPSYWDFLESVNIFSVLSCWCCVLHLNSAPVVTVSPETFLGSVEVAPIVSRWGLWIVRRLKAKSSEQQLPASCHGPSWTGAAPWETEQPRLDLEWLPQLEMT